MAQGAHKTQGSFPAPHVNLSRGKEMNSLVQEVVRATVEEIRSCRAVGMKEQGPWTGWKKAIDRKVTWTELWKAEPQRIQFLILSVYNVHQNFTYGEK